MACDFLRFRVVRTRTEAMGLYYKVLVGGVNEPQRTQRFCVIIQGFCNFISVEKL